MENKSDNSTQQSINISQSQQTNNENKEEAQSNPLFDINIIKNNNLGKAESNSQSNSQSNGQSSGQSSGQNINRNTNQRKDNDINMQQNDYNRVIQKSYQSNLGSNDLNSQNINRFNNNAILEDYTGMVIVKKESNKSIILKWIGWLILMCIFAIIILWWIYSFNSYPCSQIDELSRDIKKYKKHVSWKNPLTHVRTYSD